MANRFNGTGRRRTVVADDIESGPFAALVRREFFGRAGVLALRYGVAPSRLEGFYLRRAARGENAELESTSVISSGQCRTPARRRGPIGAARMIANMEDVVHAIACVDGNGIAWADLHELHETALIRVCAAHLRSHGHAFGEVRSTILVRRWLLSLRSVADAGRAAQVVGHASATRCRATTGPNGRIAREASRSRRCPDIPVPRLDEYAGTAPLRHWLAQRLLAPLATVLDADAADHDRLALRLTPDSDCVRLTLDPHRQPCPDRSLAR